MNKFQATVNPRYGLFRGERHAVRRGGFLAGAVLIVGQDAVDSSEYIKSVVVIKAKNVLTLF